jgi:phage major head subunit gpT-like protein
MKDDLNAIKKLPNGLADAWAYTMSDRVSSVFTTAAGAGPTLTETSRALFNTTDANLGTTALSFASYDAARTAMKKLTALGNVRRIGVGPKYLLVPPDLETTAYQIRDSDKNPDNAENGVNVHKGKFEVIVVNDWTDTDNWYLLADPADIAVVQLWYFRGQRTPQLFEATDESTGALFTNDTYRYKTRFFCARAIVDFRGAYGATVT